MSGKMWEARPCLQSKAQAIYTLIKRDRRISNLVMRQVEKR